MVRYFNCTETIMHNDVPLKNIERNSGGYRNYLVLKERHTLNAKLVNGDNVKRIGLC